MVDSNYFFENVFFKNLTERDKTVLNSNASLICFDKEEMFLKNGSRLFSVYYIQKGQIKVKDENNKLIDLLGEGDFLGLRYLYEQEPIFFSAYGSKDSKIMQIEKNVFKKFASTNSNFLIDIYNKSNENANTLVRNLLAFRRQKVHGALASFLIYYGKKNCLYNLTQKEISEILGYSRENVNRTLNDFIESKYIEIHDGEIKIINTDAIKRLHLYG